MIQRIQSLFLLLAVAAYVLLFFFPFAEYRTDDMVYTFSLLGITGGNSNSTIPLMIAVCVLAITCFVTIFLYKKRLIQIKITAITLLAHIGFIAALFYSAETVIAHSISKTMTETLSATTEIIPEYKAGMYIALLPVVFLVLAHRFIRKDEKMVRAADRLRD
ncbi:MAG: DUF4293 domain-containing protein [Bacteroidales bacterium]|jgi:glucan phosphoethanolaminetransferase (alkaline phosphatase superfamily)|nr:DUF4293 domain-containing protein [Bacteroidales bacterium]